MLLQAAFCNIGFNSSKGVITERGKSYAEEVLFFLAFSRNNPHNLCVCGQASEIFKGERAADGVAFFKLGRGTEKHAGCADILHGSGECFIPCRPFKPDFQRDPACLPGRDLQEVIGFLQKNCGVDRTSDKRVSAALHTLFYRGFIFRAYEHYGYFAQGFVITDNRTKRFARYVLSYERSDDEICFFRPVQFKDVLIRRSHKRLDGRPVQEALFPVEQLLDVSWHDHFFHEMHFT